ncbi:hypothetical protein KDAU_12930 [Dictyobacter aurantiacus]|uniref:Uncharacterized protein n=1 Tax=Dictyobacter aurantiacus TaxID=1936993 RepID=A0A401ZAS0_9CHLR|nr:hypothetical protein KDAU_12930 [Dictyobacter aurantiacus]
MGHGINIRWKMSIAYFTAKVAKAIDVILLIIVICNEDPKTCQPVTQSALEVIRCPEVPCTILKLLKSKSKTALINWGQKRSTQVMKP